jgi:hypothetical protein
MGKVAGHFRSNAVAYAALFVALSGSAYAASQVGSGDIQDDAVQRRHIDNEAVASKEVADRSLTDKDVKQPKFVPVKPASAADCSEVLEFCGSGAGIWHNEIDPADYAKDESLADNPTRAGYFVSPDGQVHLQGTVTGGLVSFPGCKPPSTDEIFILPRKLWPSRDIQIPTTIREVTENSGDCATVLKPGPAIIEISDRGAVELNDSDDDQNHVIYALLDGISFRPR